jgi:hypothetical protein
MSVPSHLPLHTVIGTLNHTKHPLDTIIAMFLVFLVFLGSPYSILHIPFAYTYYPCLFCYFTLLHFLYHVVLFYLALT